MIQRTSKTGSSSCQCSTTLNGKQEGMKNYAKIIPKSVAEYARQILRGHWSFMEPGSEKKWYGTYDDIPSLHFTACEENVQLLLKMVMFVNQLRLYGAIADMIQGLPEDQVAPGRLVASDQTVQEILVQPPVAEVPSNDERQGNLLQDHEQSFERLPEDQKLSRLCSEAGLILVEVGHFFYALPSPKEPKIRSLCGNMYHLEKTNRKIAQMGGSEATNDSALCWG